MKSILKQLHDVLVESGLTDFEISAFEYGIANLSMENQIELYRVFKSNLDLIYPTYIHYMAKKKAKDTGIGWDEAVESEIKFLDNYLSNKVVGNEVI